MTEELKEVPKKWAPDSRFPWRENNFGFREGVTFQYWIRLDSEKGLPDEPGVAEFAFLIPKKWFEPNTLQKMTQEPFPMLQVVEDRPDDLMYRLNFYSPSHSPEANRNMRLPTEQAVLGYFSKFVTEHVDALPEVINLSPS